MDDPGAVEAVHLSYYRAGMPCPSQAHCPLGKTSDTKQLALQEPVWSHQAVADPVVGTTCKHLLTSGLCLQALILPLRRPIVHTGPPSAGANVVTTCLNQASACRLEAGRPRNEEALRRSMRLATVLLRL